jgi:hypothetical protein
MSRNTRDDINHNETKEQKSVPAEAGSDPVSTEADKLTEKQKSALTNLLSRMADETAPGITVLDDGELEKIRVDHPDQQLGRQLIMEALGTGNRHFYHGLLLQLAKACSTGPEINEIQTNFILSTITSPNPKDIFATLLKAQMATVHNAAMECLGKVFSATAPALLDSAERAANKFLRTYVMLADALTRLEARAEPTVNVGTVNVAQVSQAIVGNVIQNEKPRANAQDKLPATAPPALPDAKSAAMPIIEGSRECAPVPAERSLPRFRPPGQRRSPITDQNRRRAVSVQRHRKST